MAYDPKDPADKAIVDGLIAEALAEQAEEHATEIEGLKTKRTELLAKLAKARGAGSDADAGEVTRLEGEVERLTAELKVAQKAAKEAEKARDTAVAERDTAVADRDTEAGVSRNLLVNGGLTTALIAANVDAKFLPAATALLKDKVVIKEVNGERQAFVGDKPLGEFVTEWSQSDEGKHYVTAPQNGGGGAHQNRPQGGGTKTLAEMGDVERREWATRDPAGFKAAVDAEKAAKGQT